MHFPQATVVFSTSVEVFLLKQSRSSFGIGLLHVRGGVSVCDPLQIDHQKSSPRPWRCFPHRSPRFLCVQVFSTSVEVFLPSSSLHRLGVSLLHVRGGVSGRLFAYDKVPTSSPRPWRCFPEFYGVGYSGGVFSTSVEVFPCRAVWRLSAVRLLHVRGGVSVFPAASRPRFLSSPRPWRCFRRPGGLRRYGHVFSTSVEVFSIEKLAGR